MKRPFGFKLTLAALAAYLVTLGALAIGHIASAGPSQDPAVTIPVSPFLTPLCVLASCLPVLLAAPLIRGLWNSGAVRACAGLASILLGLAWFAGLAEWLWLEQWRQAVFLSEPLPSWLHQPKLPLWIIFINAALVSLFWIIWACRSSRPIARNLVISLAYLSLWQFSVFAVEEIALSGSREVAWLLELRAVLARVGTAGLFFIGLGWVVWFVERASRRYALRRKVQGTPVTAVPQKRIWNPLDVEAWYFGNRSKKLMQSLAAFAVYSVNFLAAMMFFSLIGGCEERYEMPSGGGETKQIAQQVKIQKVIKKRYVINPFSAIIFNPPPIDDVKLQLNEATQHQYRVGYGAGEGAGFAGGTAKGKVRFIRLEYAGGDWNQDFGVGADVNMLVEYHARTGHRVSDRTESRTVGQLANFPVGAAPPFVYLTGQQNISLSRHEIKILREYLLDKHGMIFGDNGGSSHFHNQFFQMMSQVLPTAEPVRVPLDDPIHTRPYRIPFLPYVAPHGGKDAWGWKVDGRWVCYYHPGDIGDAWTDEHAGAKPDIVEFCYQLGVNVIFYAHVEYNQWLDARKQRGK